MKQGILTRLWRAFMELVNRIYRMF